MRWSFQNTIGYEYRYNILGYECLSCYFLPKLYCKINILMSHKEVIDIATALVAYDTFYCLSSKMYARAYASAYLSLCVIIKNNAKMPFISITVDIFYIVYRFIYWTQIFRAAYTNVPPRQLAFISPTLPLFLDEDSIKIYLYDDAADFIYIDILTHAAPPPYPSLTMRYTCPHENAIFSSAEF